MGPSMRMPISPQRGKRSARWPSAAASRATVAVVLRVVCPFWNRSSALNERRASSSAEIAPRSFTGDIRFYHLGGVDDAIELRLRDEAKLQRGVLQREIVVHRMMGDLRCLVVADHRRKGGHQHEGTAHVFLYLLQVRLRAFD